MRKTTLVVEWACGCVEGDIPLATEGELDAEKFFLECQKCRETTVVRIATAADHAEALGLKWDDIYDASKRIATRAACQRLERAASSVSEAQEAREE